MIAPLPFVPHPQQRRVTGIDEVDDPHVGLGRVLAVQATGVLLQRSLPRNRHSQHQGVERRMIKTLANQLSGGQQYTRRIWRWPADRKSVKARTSDPRARVCHFWATAEQEKCDRLNDEQRKGRMHCDY